MKNIQTSLETNPKASAKFEHALRDYQHAANDLLHAIEDLKHAKQDCAHAIGDFDHLINDFQHAINDWKQGGSQSDNASKDRAKESRPPKGNQLRREAFR